MRLRLQHKLLVLRDWFAVMFDGPQTLAFLPAMVLGGFWLGGEPVLLVMALGLPLCIALASYSGLAMATGLLNAPLTKIPDDRESFALALDLNLRKAHTDGHGIACFVLEFGNLGPGMSPDTVRQLRAQVLERLNEVMRDRDCTCLLADNQIGFAISPPSSITNEAGLQLARRIRCAMQAENFAEQTKNGLSVSIGFAVSDRVPGSGGKDLLNAAYLAVKEARRNSHDGVRAFAPGMGNRTFDAVLNETRVLNALEDGEIIPWFQPQVSNDTGQISGFEALARWLHPQRGVVPPADFLPILESSGQLERLGEVILQHSCKALKAWDSAGLSVPQVGVNFTVHELSNPLLIDKIAWELDRNDLSPNRICVEILETVVATALDDTLTRNVHRLSDIGFGIDLDDFGTAHASMTSIRRFAVQRLKIDRSFVARVDRDPEQRRMVSAIILMAEQLALDTLAEGVETAGEHTLLAQLGCGHVQGFGIGRPMPLADTFGWIERHLTRLQAPPEIGRKSGGKGQ